MTYNADLMLTCKLYTVYTIHTSYMYACYYVEPYARKNGKFVPVHIAGVKTKTNEREIFLSG